MTIYRITKQTGFYEEICNLLIALQGVSVSTEYIISGKAVYAPGDYLTIESQHLNSEVRLPLFGPLQAAIHGVEPEQIDITVVTKKEEREYSKNISGLQRFFDSIFKPFIVSYFEAHKSEIKIKYTASRDKWPDAWQMAWAVRNAVSHNGTVYHKSPNGTQVSWRRCYHSPSIEQNSPILKRINGGDMLVLLIEMEETRTAKQLVL